MDFSDDLDWITLEEIVEDIALFKSTREAVEQKEMYRLVENNADLLYEALKMLPYVNEVCGKPGEKIIGAQFMTKLEERFCGGASYYNGVLPFLRLFGIPLSRINSHYIATDTHEPSVQGILAHEMAHCASSNESATTLRGIEINARIALTGDASHVYAFYNVLHGLACGAGTVKAIYEGRRDEFLEMVEDKIDKNWSEYLRKWIDGEKCNVDHYNKWIYNVLPYKAFKLALEQDSDSVPVPQPPSFSTESKLLSSLAVMRTILGIADESPVQMPAALELYRRAKDI